jgi:hypothetical protein
MPLRNLVAVSEQFCDERKGDVYEGKFGTPEPLTEPADGYRRNPADHARVRRRPGWPMPRQRWLAGWLAPPSRV